MDREWLERELERGRSLADIAAEVGRHPSTVSYWATKHGLSSRYVRVYRPRGGIAEHDLRELVGRGLSIRQIAAQCRLSPTTVRHWLQQFGLRTEAARMRSEARAARAGDVLLRRCNIHGLTEFRRVGRQRSFRCPQCVSARVAQRRRQLKEIVVAEAGGACALCGYHRCMAALHFHHLDPAAKRFQFASRGVTRSLAALREEARKCVLLCANCHAEVEAGCITPDTLSGVASGPG